MPVPGSICPSLPTVHNTKVQNYGMKLLFLFLTKHFINSLSLSLSANMPGFLFFLFCFFLASSQHITISFSADTLTSTQILLTNQTLICPSQVFALGFFPGTNSTWYLGTWYNNINDRTIVWVANRDNPLENSNGFLTIGENGNIVLTNPLMKKYPVWSSNATTKANNNYNNPVLQLLDTGNLVLREANITDPTKYLWQSFDYPTDTLLPGMKMGWNLDTGVEKHLTSWKATGSDPSSGDYSFKIDTRGIPEIFLRDEQNIIYRSGPWNGERFSGVPEMQPDTDSITFDFSYDKDGVYYLFSIGNRSILSRLVVTSGGELQRLTWVPSSNTWTKFWYARKDQCDGYRACGPYGLCDSNASPVCMCVGGFRPRNLQAWNLRDGSDGCVRNTDLNCGSDKFLHLENVKLPETTYVFANRTMNLRECEDLCRKNCSCTAYANIEITNGGSGCVTWTGELIDMRLYPAGGQDLYVRLAASDVDDIGSGGGSHKKNHTGEVVGITISAAVIILGLVVIFWKKRKLLSMSNVKAAPRGSCQRSRDLLMTVQRKFSTNRENSGERNMDDIELPMFDFNTITMATDNFSEANKLGQGGFGIVYRGRLMEGQDIAVKRLSKSSMQGVEEFKNEIKLIVRLQHRNLVRLFGCCIEMHERLLVYEYMENRSLDSILFDKAKKPILDWKRRFNIICGIARGLLYLHHDSRFRIIHRDLKASNILLDSEMNPKISDFGMARLFGSNQTEANTSRVVGTYGYMSPEYAMDGNFSVKSDVFSFGVLVLEIITGKKNRGFYYSNEDMNLLGNAWRQWRDGSASELIDSSIGDSYSPSEVLRCIHVGLLCVQERAEDRPTMSSVLLMLSSESVLMPQPRNLGFSIGKNPAVTDSSSSKKDESWSVNQVTVTLLDAR